MLLGSMRPVLSFGLECASAEVGVLTFMQSYPDNDEIPLPLVRRLDPPLRITHVIADAEDDGGRYDSAIPSDRVAPSTAGGIAGLFAGVAALGVVHAAVPTELYRPIAAVAIARGVDVSLSFGMAYLTAASIGALVGATFAVVTRYLRKWGPLAFWAFVFFVSLTMLLLAVSSAYGRGVGPALNLPILAAGAIYGLVVAFSLPIRRRR